MKMYLESLQFSLNLIRGELNQLESVLSEFNNVIPLTELSQETETLDVSLNKVIIIQSNLTFLETLIRRNDQVMTARQVTNQIFEKYPDYIPTQILQPMNYIDRKLKKTCNTGNLEFRKIPYTSTIVYGLQEWIGMDNFFLPKYLTRSMILR